MEQKSSTLIRTSTMMQRVMDDIEHQRQWGNETAATHYVNPTVTTCGTSTGNVYTAASLGLGNST